MNSGLQSRGQPSSWEDRIAFPAQLRTPAFQLYCCPFQNQSPGAHASAFTSPRPFSHSCAPHRRRDVCTSHRAPKASAVSLPATYEGLYQRAAAAAKSALLSGVTAAEIEFPATPSLSRSGDGSRAAERAERAGNARLAAIVAQVVNESGKGAVVIAFDSRMAGAVRKEVAGSSVSVAMVGEDIVNECAEATVLVAAMPAAEEDWKRLEMAVGRGWAVIVCNGAFFNGLEWLEPVFHLKPCSGYGTSTGFLLREYPAPYVVVSSRTGEALEDLEVEVLRQGRLRRPDFQAVSTALMTDFYASS